MKSRRLLFKFALTATVALLLLSISGIAFGANGVSQKTTLQAGEVVNDDLFMGGQTLRVDGTVNGDLWAAGNNISFSGTTMGDVFSISQNTSQSGLVGGSVRALGQHVRLSSKVGRSVALAAFQVEVLPDCTIGGNGIVTAQKATISGKVTGSLRVYAEDVTLGGEIGRDVHVAANRLQVLPGTKIRGSLTYETREAIRLDPAVQVSGAVKHIPVDRRSTPAGRQQDPVILWALSLAALLVLTLVMVLLMPRATHAVTDTIRQKPGVSALVGTASMLALPLAAVISFVTVIGRGMGFTLLTTYFTVISGGIIFAKVFLGVIFGEWLFTSVIKNSTVLPVWKALTGAMVMNLVSYVPVLGGMVGVASFLVTAGALLYLAYEAWVLERSPAGA